MRIASSAVIITGIVVASCTGPAGPKGDAGGAGAASSCTIADNGDGTHTITCSDGSSAVVTDGSAGTSCSIADNGDGTKTITCSDGTTVTVPAAPALGAITGSASRADTGDRAGIAVAVDGSALTAVTTADGSFTIAGVPNGVVDLTFTDAGHRDEHARGVVVAGGTSVVANVVLGLGRDVADFPDGTSILIRAVTAHNRAVAVRLDDVREAVACVDEGIVVDTGGRAFATASSDGARVFVAGDEGFGVVDCATRAFVDLIDDPVVTNEVFISGDTIVVFARARIDGNSGQRLTDLYTVDAAAGLVATQLSTGHTSGTDVRFVIKPTSLLAFHENPGPNGEDDLVVTRSDGSGRHVIVSNVVSEVVARAGNDAALAYALFDPSGAISLFRYNAATQASLPLADANSIDLFAAFLNGDAALVDDVDGVVTRFDRQGAAESLFIGGGPIVADGAGDLVVTGNGGGIALVRAVGSVQTIPEAANRFSFCVPFDGRFVAFSDAVDTRLVDTQAAAPSSTIALTGAVVSQFSGLRESVDHQRELLVGSAPNGFSSFAAVDEATGNVTPLNVFLPDPFSISFVGNRHVVISSEVLSALVSLDDDVLVFLTPLEVVGAERGAIVGGVAAGAFRSLRVGDTAETVTDRDVLDGVVAGKDGIAYVRPDGLDRRVHVLLLE